MPTDKLTIVPVKLDSPPTESATLRSAHDAVAPSCIIKTAETEILFFNGVDECIIQTIMKELKSR